MRLVLVSIILVSSANKTGWDLLFTFFGKSFIQTRKNKDLGIEYCVTSCFNFLQLEKVILLRHVLYIITLIPILNVGFR
jgi:hypothetical protein